MLLDPKEFRCRGESPKEVGYYRDDVGVAPVFVENSEFLR